MNQKRFKKYKVGDMVSLNKNGVEFLKRHLYAATLDQKFKITEATPSYYTLMITHHARWYAELEYLNLEKQTDFIVSEAINEPEI